jgi:hypothetical protein
MLIEVICTGDEVLTGKIVSTNFSYMTRSWRMLDCRRWEPRSATIAERCWRRSSMPASAPTR